MWQATIIETELDDGALKVTVEYTDGTRTITETYRSTGGDLTDWIEKTAKNKIQRLKTLDQATIPIGPVGPPTERDPDEVEWCNALRTLRRLDILITTGIITKNDSRYQALTAQVAADLDKYWDLFERGVV